MPGLSQTDCLAGKGSEGDRGPCAACQSAKYVSNWVSAVQADANKICDWRSEVQNWVQIYQSVQSGVGKLSCNKTALKRCTTTETLWNRKVPSLSSPEDKEIFLPKLSKSWHADVFKGLIIIIKIHDQVSLVCIIVLCYSINKLTYLLNQTQSNVVIRQVDTEYSERMHLAHFA